jgi:GNAT superfamily N-acetyltransferase
MNVTAAETDAQILACFPVMAQLRPHLLEDEFVSRVRRQTANGYRLVYIAGESGQAVAAAGFRLSECLAWGRFLYVDDLVTLEADRSRGYGRVLFDFLVARAIEAGCGQLHLDSAVHRFGAHRFYLMHRMKISSHHFALELASSEVERAGREDSKKPR